MNNYNGGNNNKDQRGSIPEDKDKRNKRVNRYEADEDEKEEWLGADLNK